MKYLYLHGLGQKPDSWDRVIKETTVSDRSVSLSWAEMLEGKAATYKELYTAFSEECNKENDEIVLCGLSLGAVLALNYAIDHPDKVKALVLIAAQYKMPKKLLKFQNMLFRFMPNATFKKFGFKRCKGIPKESECYYLCVARGCKMLFVSDVCFAVNDWDKNDPRIHKKANCRYKDTRTALDIVYELIKADMLKSEWE